MQITIDKLQEFAGGLCVEWGFCNWLADDALADGQQTLTAGEFARSLLASEGVDFDAGLWMVRIAERFEKQFGPEVDLVWLPDQA